MNDLLQSLTDDEKEQFKKNGPIKELVNAVSGMMKHIEYDINNFDCSTDLDNQMIAKLSSLMNVVNDCMVICVSHCNNDTSNIINEIKKEREKSDSGNRDKNTDN